MCGEPLAILLPFPGRFRRRSTGIWAGAAGNHAQGPNCKRPVLSRVIFTNQGYPCEESKVPGACLKICSEVVFDLLLKLVKCVENRRQYRIMQTQFCWIRAETCRGQP
jgi:hypothetical protein